MKTIIVPTDYSENAQNATEYAVQLAKNTQAKIKLLHVFNLPAVIEGVPVRLLSLDDLYEKHSNQLKKLVSKITVPHNVQVDTHVEHGEIADVLPEFVKDQEGDIVVMGMRGMNKVEKLLFGSVTTDILKNANFPLLIIPENVKFNPIKHILLACDYHSDSISRKLYFLKGSALSLNAEVKVIHIHKPEEEFVTAGEKLENAKHLDRLFKGIRHSYTQVINEDIVEGILEGIKVNNSDLLVMIPRKRNFWQSLTTGSHTERIAFDVDIPLLALPHSDEKLL